MHKFHFVEKFSFKERRFLNKQGDLEEAKGKVTTFFKKGLDVLGGVVDAGKKIVGDKPKVVVQPAVVAPAPGKPAVVEGGAGAQAQPAVAPEVATAVVPVKPAPEFVDRKTADLGKLQGELSGKLEAPSLKSYLDEVGKISGIEFQRIVEVANPNFDVLKGDSTNGLFEAIFKEFSAKKANFSGFAKVFGIESEVAGTLEKDVKMIVSMALANSFVKEAKADFAVKYAHLTAFLATDAGKAFAEENIEAKFIYTATGGVSVELAGGGEFEGAYAEFAKAQPAEATKSEDVAKVAKEGALPTRDAKLQCMENSKIGKMLKFFGVNFGDVLEGKSPFAALAFVMLGFGGKLGLPDSDIFDGLPDSQLTAGLKKTVDQLRVAAKKSGYGIDKDPIDYTKLDLNPSNYDVFDVKRFLDTVQNKKALDQAKDGIKLSEEFKLGKGGNPANVKVDLTDGGEIVVEGGTAEGGVKLTINGKEVIVYKGTVVSFRQDTADGDIKAKSGIAVLTGVIPVGTVFTKKCKLSEEKVKTSAAQ